MESRLAIMAEGAAAVNLRHLYKRQTIDWETMKALSALKINLELNIYPEPPNMAVDEVE